MTTNYWQQEVLRSQREAERITAIAHFATGLLIFTLFTAVAILVVTA